MAERDYKSSPVADGLGLRAVIDGLASDLQDLRDGRLSPPQAMAHAAVAKQLFNGVRLFLIAHQSLSKRGTTHPSEQTAGLIEGSDE